jgi:Papain family cysteine protease
MDVVDKYGPVAVSVYVDTDTRAWYLYKDGVFTADGLSARDMASCSTNHAVLLVGYGTDAEDNNYWLACARPWRIFVLCVCMHACIVMLWWL